MEHIADCLHCVDELAPLLQDPTPSSWQSGSTMPFTTSATTNERRSAEMFSRNPPAPASAFATASAA
jgi:hypothetical protein